jgi:hypothetical protein
MPKINTKSSGHTGPGPTPGGDGTIWEFHPFTSNRLLQALKVGIAKIDSEIKNWGPCNAAFKALPLGKSFAELWSSHSIWISYDPSVTPNRFGATLGNEITITQWALEQGVYTIAGTLVHELAHVGGAPGSDKQAEGTLPSCRLKSPRGPYDPTITGKLLIPRIDHSRLA